MGNLFIGANLFISLILWDLDASKIGAKSHNHEIIFIKYRQIYKVSKGEIIFCDEDESNIYSDTSKENSGFGWCNNFKGFIPYRYIIENS